MPSFDKDKDKITQAEVVYDFLERLTMGKDMDLDTHNGYTTTVKNVYTGKKGLLFIKILKVLLCSLPSSVIFNIANIEIHKIVVNIKTSNPFCRIDGGNYELVKAYSENTGMELSSLFRTEYSSTYNNTTFSMPCDCGYPNTDNIIIYIKKK